MKAKSQRSIDKLRTNGNPTECTENPIDSASTHWNSEASVAGRKSRAVRWKSSSSPSLSPSRVQGPKVRRSNLRNMEDVAERIGKREKRNIHSLRDLELLDALRILELGNCARIKSKGYRGLLFHCASRSVPRKVMQSAVYGRSVIGDVSATSRTSRKYLRVFEGEVDNVFQTRPTASISLIRVSETAKLFIEFA